MSEAYGRIMDAARSNAPEADVHGVMVQPMADPGVEMILGLTRDPDFGLMLLDGVRGAPPADVDALVDVMLSLSRIAHALGDGIEALDLNPVIVHPRGVTVVDALLVPRRP